MYTLYIKPFDWSRRTTSEISKTLIGRGMFLLLAMVFNNPGRSVVRAICEN